MNNKVLNLALHSQKSACLKKTTCARFYSLLLIIDVRRQFGAHK